MQDTTSAGEQVRSGASTRIKGTAMLLLSLVMAFALAIPARALADEQAPSSSVPDVQQDIVSTVQSLETYFGVTSPSDIYSSSKMVAGSSESDWFAFELKLLGVNDGSSDYLKWLEDYVSQSYGTDNQLDRVRSTEWNRISLVVEALGGDPTSFGNNPSGGKIDLISDGIYNWSHTSDIALQGSNAYMYALEALHASGVEVPSDAKYTQQQLIDGLLSYQNEDGSYGLTKGTQDGDLTAMAVVALEPYQAENPDVADSINRAMDWLSNAQQPNGRFTSGGVESSESSSMVILALSAEGRDARTDPDFIKNGISAYDALMSYRRADGSFSHADNDNMQSFNEMPTDQALRALISIYELESGGDGNIYTFDCDMHIDGISSGASIGGSTGQSPLPWILGGVVVGVVIVVIAVLVSNSKRKKKRAERDAARSAKAASRGDNSNEGEKQ